jgi:DNA (cytosine-5)-methyltransferase 1
MMRYGSVCSGIEAASVAWRPLGWEAAFVSEIDKAASAVLAHHYPKTPNLGDMTRFQEWSRFAIDVLVGGTPCQSFSVAGLRRGLDDPRGSLMLTFGAIARRLRPRWLLWENVPGVLSSDGGRDFGAFLGMLGELGYGFAYRVLDAQFFGLAQRRARVFVVGYLGDWRPPAAVLFERESLRGGSPPSRKAGQTAPTIPSRSTAGGGLGTDFDCDGGLIAIAIQGAATRENPNSGPGGVGVRTDDCAFTLEARSEVQSVTQPFTLAIRGRGDSHDLEYRTDGTANALPEIEGSGDSIGALRAADGGSSRDYVASFNHQSGGSRMQIGLQSEPGQTVQRNQMQAIMRGTAVRRLTPRECERLQGFPDDYTLIPYRGKTMADGPRYKMLGNSMAVPVMQWIGARIDLVDALLAPEVTPHV